MRVAELYCIRALRRDAAGIEIYLNNLRKGKYSACAAV